MLDSPSWYRFASTILTSSEYYIRGCDGFITGINIERSYNNNPNGVHKILFAGCYNYFRAKTIYSCANSHLITKLRYVINVERGKGYLEFYYIRGLKNNVKIWLDNNMDFCLDKEISKDDETPIDDGTVIYTYEIPSIE